MKLESLLHPSFSIFTHNYPIINFFLSVFWYAELEVPQIEGLPSISVKNFPMSNMLKSNWNYHIQWSTNRSKLNTMTRRFEWNATIDSFGICQMTLGTLGVDNAAIARQHRLIPSM
jgi:hypothetical protein